MTEPTDIGDSAGRTESTAESRSGTGMPRWVKISLVIVGALIALFVILNLTGRGGQHGPGRHVGSMNQGAPATIESSR